MMTENFCSYAGTRGEIVVAYLYDDIAADDRAAFERHMVSCALCRSEVTALGDVRSEMSRWSPPDYGVRSIAAEPVVTPVPVRRRGLDAVPVWMQAAAAVVLLGIGLGAANLEVRYGADGLSINTGWRHQEAVVATAAPAVAAPIAAPVSAQDLAALEAKLQRAIDARPAAVQVAATDTEGTLRRVRALVVESEQRQQRELALRLGETVRDIQLQRQADLVKIDRSLGQSGIEVMRTQRQMNALAQQVSQQR